MGGSRPALSAFLRGALRGGPDEPACGVDTGTRPPGGGVLDPQLRNRPMLGSPGPGVLNVVVGLVVVVIDVTVVVVLIEVDSVAVVAVDVIAGPAPRQL